MNSRLLGYLCVCLLILATACTSLKPNPNAVQNAQATIQAVADAQPSGIPDHFIPEEPAQTPRAADDWDVNAYFGVLTHLSVEPGYVIDYFYSYEGMGGHPFVYARPSDKSPYASFEEYLANVPGGAPDSASQSEYTDEYLNHIKIDDTPDGYFQFVALRIMDNQFYQFWHAAYNDTTIVCDDDGLKQTLSAADDAFEGGGVPGSVRNAASKIDLAPTVEFLDDATALVRLVTFSKWGGFVEIRYTIGRAFPHSIVSSETETLVEYDCGVSF
jgi:hypothetical protein